MADIHSTTAEIMRAKKEEEEKKNKRQDENIYGLPYYTGRPLKIQDGGGCHLEKSKNCQISATVRRIATKIGTAMHIFSLQSVDRENFENLKIEAGGRPPFWKKSKNRHISATV